MRSPLDHHIDGLRQHPSDSTNPTSELAHAFVGAQRAKYCVEPDATADRSTDHCAELTGAVRAFVAAGRADGSPPERVLANIKGATRHSFVHGIDEVHSDRLRKLILQEFLTTYYDAAVPADAALQRPE